MSALSRATFLRAWTSTERGMSLATSKPSVSAKRLVWFLALVLALGAGVAPSIRDQGSGSSARAVLNLIKAEGASAVLHQGDFDYNDNPPAWDALITEVLGASFPYFAVSGNHDTSAWSGTSGYGAFIEARMRRVGVPWAGQIGIQFAFK